MSEMIRLNLVFPPRLESLVIDTLTADARMPGFTVLRAEGHTSSFAKASASEQVRGRVERRVLWMLIDATMKDEVIELLAKNVDSRDLRWWSERVLDMGRLGQ